MSPKMMDDDCVLANFGVNFGAARIIVKIDSMRTALVADARRGRFTLRPLNERYAWTASNAPCV